MRISANVTFMFSSSFCGTRHAFDPDGSALESYRVVADLACNLNLNSQLQQENASIVLFFSFLGGVLTVSFAPLFARVSVSNRFHGLLLLSTSFFVGCQRQVVIPSGVLEV